MARFETILVRDGTYILTTHEGDVGITQTLAAMARKAELLEQHPDVRFVVFDYRAATMASQRGCDAMRAATETVRMLDAHPSIALICVTPEDIDYGVARMCEQHVWASLGADQTTRRTFVVRSMDEAQSIMTELQAA